MDEPNAIPEAAAEGNGGVTTPALRRAPDGRFERDPALPSRGWKQGRPGGLLGNLGGSRRPWETYWRRRALKPKDRWALYLVRDYIPALQGDKPDATAAETRLMELASVSRVCWALALSRLEDQGGPDLGTVARFVSEERAALVALGLERRAKPVDPLQAVRDAVERANEELAE